MFFLFQKACDEMIKGGIKEGAVVNVSSITCVSTGHSLSLYATAKAGIECFTRCLAEEMAKNGIRVNCMRPGFIDTPMTSGVSTENVKGALKLIPLRRPGQPEEIAELALFLSTSRSSYMTGTCIPISGGYTM